MKTALCLLLLVVATTNAQNFQNVCRRTEVVFLLDHSENAKKASTLTDNNTFQLLKEAWNKFMGELQQAGDNLFKIQAFAYSSTEAPVELVPRGSAPSQSMNPKIGQMSSGGSWTYTGLNKLVNEDPMEPNNVVVIISAQGSFSQAKHQLAQAAYNAIAQRRWNTYVIGCKSSKDIDTTELTIVNGNRAPVILDDGQASNKKSYRLLGNQLTALKNQILCPRQQIVYTTPRPFVPVVTTPRPLPPSTGICSNCKVEAGSGFDRSPNFCDAFYRCLPNDKYVQMFCGQGLIWNEELMQCVRPSASRTCPIGACNANTPAGTSYPSGLCCNMYFDCVNGLLKFTKCPSKQVYQNGRCVTVQDPEAYCRSVNSNFCNLKLVTQTNDCKMYSPDPTGNPCRFFLNNLPLVPAAGTVWSQSACSQVASNACQENVISNKGLTNVSDVCSAILLSTFDAGQPDAVSPRYPTMDIFVEFYNVKKLMGNLLYHAVGTNDASAYYYFFNHNEIAANSAFRIKFKLDSKAAVGSEYDLLSNNYCGDCPETMGITFTKTSQNDGVITVKVTEKTKEKANNFIQSVTRVSGADQWLDLTVIWGQSDIHGQVKVLSQKNNYVNARVVSLQTTQHNAGAIILSNDCGLLLGSGPNVNFIGLIDVFAYYSACRNIDDVLSLQ